MNLRRSIPAALIAVFALFNCLSPGLAAEQAFWLAPVDGLWSDSTKWSTDPAFPGVNHDAVIDAPGAAYTVTASVNNLTVNSVELNAPTATLALAAGTFIANNGISLNSGTLLMNAGVLRDTTVTSSGGTFLLAPGAAGTTRVFRNVLLDADLDFDGMALTIEQGLTIAAGRTVRTAGAMTIRGAQTVAGNGEIILDGNGGGRLTFRDGSADLWSIASGLTIRSGSQGGWIRQESTQGEWTIAGSIYAETPGQTMYVGGRWHSSGTLHLSAGTLMLGGTFNSSSLESFTRTAGTLALAGSMINSGTFTLDDNTGDLYLVRDGDSQLVTAGISGGTVTTQGAHKLIVSRGLVSDVWLDCDVIVPSQGSFTANGITHVNNRSIQVNGAQLRIGQQLLGQADIVFNTGAFSGNQVWVGAPGTPSTIGPQITLRTGEGTFSFFGQNFSFVNEGTILATPGRSVGMIQIGSFTNKGLMRADSATLTIAGSWRNDGTIIINDSTLNLAGSFSASGIGTIHRSGGTVNLVGVYDNTGNTLALDSVTGPWHMLGGSIQGGTITATAGAHLRAKAGTATSTLNGASLNTDLYVDPGAVLRLLGQWENNGTIHIDSGTVIFRDDLTYERLGTLQRKNAKLVIGGPFDNVGRTFDIDGPFDQWTTDNLARVMGGTISSSSGAPLYINGGTFTGVTLQADSLLTGASIRFQDGLTLQDSKMRLISSTGFPQVALTGPMTIDGNGEIVIDGNGWCSFSFNGGTVTLGPGVILRTGTGGGATFGTQSTASRIVNHGLISAQGQQRWLATAGIDNHGTLRAIDGGTLLISSFFGFSNTGTVLVGPHSAIAFQGTFSNAGTFDIGGTLLVHYLTATPLNLIVEQLGSGYNGGTWDGPGMNSSPAAANAHHAVGYAEASAIFSSFPATFAGQTVISTTLLLHYTRYGDANLDGRVDLADFNTLAANFGTSGRFWWQGDFNYDGLVNLADFNLLAANFGFAAAGSDVPTPDDWANLASHVPEPAAPAFVSLAALIAMGRFRRQIASACP